MTLLLGGACAVAYTMPTGNHLFPTALVDGADPSSCFALSEITATTSWCVKSCRGQPSICPPDLCSCSSPSKASTSSQKVTLFVDPGPQPAREPEAAVLQSNEQVIEQAPNASLVDADGTHLPAKALFKALEFGSPSAIGMANTLYMNETEVNGSVVLQQGGQVQNISDAAGPVNQSAKAFWRALEFGKPIIESIANTTYMNGTVVAAPLEWDATALQQSEQMQNTSVGAGPANMSVKDFWRALEFGKPSDSIANTTYMNGTVVNAPLDAAALQSTEQQVPDAAGPVNQSAKAFWRALEFGKPIESIANTTYMNGTVVAAPARAALADATVLNAMPAVAPLQTPIDAAVSPVSVVLEVAVAATVALSAALEVAVAAPVAPALSQAENVAVPAVSVVQEKTAPEAATTGDEPGKRVPQPASVKPSTKGGMSFINFLSFKKSKDALPEDPSQALENTQQASSESTRNPWATRHDDAQLGGMQQLDLAQQVAMMNAQGEAAMQARQEAAPAHEKGFVGILRSPTVDEKLTAEERAAAARKNFADAVAVFEQEKALEDELVPGTLRPRPPVELAPAVVPGAIAFSSFKGSGSPLFMAFESHRSSSDDQL